MVVLVQRDTASVVVVVDAGPHKTLEAVERTSVNWVVIAKVTLSKKGLSELR